MSGLRGNCQCRLAAVISCVDGIALSLHQLGKEGIAGAFVPDARIEIQDQPEFLCIAGGGGQVQQGIAIYAKLFPQAAGICSAASSGKQKGIERGG